MADDTLLQVLSRNLDFILDETGIQCLAFSLRFCPDDTVFWEVECHTTTMRNHNLNYGRKTHLLLHQKRMKRKMKTSYSVCICQTKLSYLFGVKWIIMFV